MVDTKQAATAVQNGNMDKTQGRRQYRRTYHQDGRRKEKNLEAIPMLCYGPSKNFMKFTEALSNKELLDFGNYIIVPDQPYRESYCLDDDPDVLNKLDYLHTNAR
jgi:hypothetical protein